MVPVGWSVEPWSFPHLDWQDKLRAEGTLRDPTEVEGGSRVVGKSGEYGALADPSSVSALYRGRLLSTCWCGTDAVVVTWEQVRAYDTETCGRKRCQVIAAMSPGAKLALVPKNKTAMGPKFHANLRNGSSD